MLTFLAAAGAFFLGWSILAGVICWYENVNGPGSRVMIAGLMCVTAAAGLFCLGLEYLASKFYK